MEAYIIQEIGSLITVAILVLISISWFDYLKNKND